ncbi:domain 1 of RNA polymerase Rpb1, partial [Helicosporidium sp. ATCC 50920]
MTSAVAAAGSTAELTRAMASKEQFVEPNVPRKIKKISFGIMPPHEMINNAEFQVHERTLYKMPERRPAPGGVLDARLGVSSKRAQCETCGLGLTDCVGHFGYIKLALPVFHIGYFKSTVQTLQCICKSCSRVLLPPSDKRTLLRRLASTRMERTAREAAFRRVLERCKRTRACPYCGADNGVVKKAPGSLKILHDPSPRSRGADRPTPGDLSESARRNELLKAALPRALDDLHPLRVSALLAAIPDADVALLDVAGRPEHALVSVLPVPPVCIRPSVEMDGGAGSNEDDLSMKLMQIVEVNNVLRAGLAKGLACVSLMENWDFLQVQCAMYINADLPGLSASYQMPGKPMRGFVQRLKGKSGRFRGNLSGKRVDFSGRTVISPDPNLAISQVAVPRAMASTLTFPETVTPHNLARLRALVFNGQSRWPGAAFVVLRNQDRVWLKYGDCRRIASELRPGDVVERHLLDGDVVLFNRQPSLHRMSIMAHTVRVIGPWRTLRFNESVCSPYNADFDGDEMNVHVPQTYEARAEALELMGVERNLKTPKSGEILVAATQDFLTAAWLITARDALLTRAQFCQALAHGLGALAARSWLPPPAILKPVELWTGKQLFSLLLRPGRDDPVAVTMETAEKVFSMHRAKKGSEPADAPPPLSPHMCPNDGYVAFRNSTLLCGRLGKVTLGGGGISGLFAALSGDYSPAAAAEVMARLARLSARQLGQVGFSIGLDDLTPAPALVESKSNTVQAGYAQCDSLLEQYARGSLPLQPGCDAEQSLEAGVTGVLNGIRDAAARVCVAGLTRGNAALIMSQCGSKGSPINIAQMVACVGQQSVGGRRVPDGFAQRSLPHFARGDRAPAAKGFVANSFYSGLTPTEFFFHTMAGREGLVDTAVKTAETGYMSRRLMKALEDLYAHYDGTVRNAAAAVVQLEYGEDGMDPVSMEGDGHQPLALDRMLQ